MWFCGAGTTVSGNNTDLRFESAPFARCVTMASRLMSLSRGYLLWETQRNDSAEFLNASGSWQVMSIHAICVACWVELVVLAGDSAERYHGLPVASQGASASLVSPQGKADWTACSLY